MNPARSSDGLRAKRLTELDQSVCGHIVEVIDERERRGQRRAGRKDQSWRSQEALSTSALLEKRGERLSWVLSGTLLLIILLNLATAYGMNLWNREVFDALEKRDSEAVLFLSMLYVPLSIGAGSSPLVLPHLPMLPGR